MTPKEAIDLLEAGQPDPAVIVLCDYLIQEIGPEVLLCALAWVPKEEMERALASLNTNDALDVSKNACRAFLAGALTRHELSDKTPTALSN